MPGFAPPQRRSAMSSSDRAATPEPLMNHAAPDRESPNHGWSFSNVPLHAPAHASGRSSITINQPGDMHEQEADRIAEHVMRSTLPASPEAGRATGATARLQRACACGGTCSRCSGKHPDAENEHLQRKATASNTQGTALAPPVVHDVLGSPAHPLDAATRAFMEPRFGYNLGSVRVHDDDRAAASADAVGSRAYTVGNHLVFGRHDRPSHDAASQRLVAHELAHVIQQQGPSLGRATLMREPAKPAKTPPPAPAPCTFTCTDAAFLGLSPTDREQLFDQSCPTGYPPETLFFGQPIPGETSAKLRRRLLAAAARAKRLMCLSGKDPAAYQLDRKIGTYANHSPAVERAVDIDYQGQTYVLHEAYAHKDAVEQQLNPVYNRIAFWAHGTKSIIPRGIQTVEQVAKGPKDARTWSNPDSGQKEAITTGELYDKLSAESAAMTDYFDLLNASDADLQQRIQTFVTQHVADAAAAGKLDLPADATAIDVPKFRRRIANDYRLLGGSKAQLKDFTDQLTADSSSAPPTVKDGDKRVDLARPFRGGAVAGATTKKGDPDPAANRRPELGFVTLPREVVVGLTQEGLAWGAIDFGGESGDIMHFDCRLDASGC